MVSAAVVVLPPEEKYPSCLNCDKIDCPYDSYPGDELLEESLVADKPVSPDSRTFKIASKKKNGAEQHSLTTVFKNHGGSPSSPPLGIITNTFKKDILWGVTYDTHTKFEDYIHAFIVNATSGCTMPFPAKKTPTDIETVLIFKEKKNSE